MQRATLFDNATAQGAKPALRGVSHQIALFVAFGASVVLVLAAPSARAAWCAFVFGACLVALFATSALYHRVSWSDVGRLRMRRLDHSAIFVLIAGGYTPLFALVPSSHGDHAALVWIWAGATAGILKSVAWPQAPKWMTAALCVGLGWMVVGQVLDRAAAVGSLAIGLLVASGATYSVGAAVYATKRPDPSPRVFGYHEVFHAIVIFASALLFAHVTLVLRRA
jgi:hemolysin III